jgi:ankyrin repeat protein
VNIFRREVLVGAAGMAGFAAAGRARQSAPKAQVLASTESGKFRAAALHGDTNAMSAMLERDAALLYCRDENGASVFLLAALARQEKAADFLITHGLKPDLHEAAAAGHVDRLTELLKTDPGSLNLRDIAGYTPLHRAAQLGRSDVIWLLLMKGALLDAKNHLASDVTPLHLALQLPDLKAAELSAGPLLSNGVDPNAKLTDGRTPLHIASEKGYAQIAAVLLRKGADPAARDAHGQQPLDCAKHSGTAEMIRLLENPQLAGRDNYSARYLYVRNGESIHRDDTAGLPQNWINQFVMAAHFDFDKTKQSYGKCPDLLMTRSTFDEIAVEAATHMGREDTAAFLLDKGSPYSTTTAAMFGDSQHIRRLLREDSARIAERGPHDFPLMLYTAFGRERPDIAELLLQSGADVNANSNGLSALHVCAKKGYVDLAVMLLEHGARKDMQSKLDDFQTPLQLAQAAKQRNEKLIAVLRG